jgi:hypothetical protein
MHYKSINSLKITNLIKNINKYCFDSKNIIELDLLSKIQNTTSEDFTKSDDFTKSEDFTKSDDFTKSEEVTKSEEFIIPSQDDNIFWCWYIFQNGIKEYNLPHKFFVIEKTRKIDWVPLLRENKASIKQLKYKLSNLENNLVNEEKMHITTLESICFINNIDFYIVKNKMLYKNSQDNENRIILKYYPKTKKYGILLDTVDVLKRINKYEEELFLVDDIAKPLKSISSYKLKDLQNIATKLDIELKKENQKNKTKKCLYSEIQEILV